MIYVKSIDWIVAYTPTEARVLLTNDHLEILCYAQPCTYKEGDIVYNSLYCYQSGLPTRYANNIYMIKHLYGYKYHIIGKVNDNTVQVEDYTFMGLNLPKDIKTGDYIEFFCDRIDL